MTILDLNKIGSTLSFGTPLQVATPPIAPTTITSKSLTPTPNIQLPPAPVNNTNYSGYTANGNAMIGANTTAITPSGATVNTQTGEVIAPPANQPSSALDTFKSYISSIVKPPSSEGAYKELYNSPDYLAKQAKANTDAQAFKDAQAEFDGLNAQLQGLDAEAKGIPIKLQQDSTGRGITAGGLAPIEADQLRANALKAIPIQTQALVAQAKIAAAQGNAQLSQSILQQAESHLDKVFQTHLTDANNEYKHQNDLLDKVYEFASKQKQQQIDDRKATLASNNTQFNAFINDVRTISSAAISSGQAALASQLTQLISGLDPNSKTFTQDFQRVNQQIAQIQGKIIPKSTTTAPKGSVISGTLTYTPQDQQEDSQALEASRGAEDHYVDPTLYQHLYKLWIEQGGQLEDFLKTYPPKNYINPANTWLPTYLGGKKREI